MEITYRTAKKPDCMLIAEMIDIASGGVVEFLFHDLMPEHTPVQIVAHNLERSQEAHTYKNAIVAEADDRIVGMALSFPSHFHEVTAEMRQYFPAERLEHLSDFYAARVEDSFFFGCLMRGPKVAQKGYRKSTYISDKEKSQTKRF
ncbi:MAG: hypothetical protein PVI71_11050 [Desulfobacterales bacterium]